MSDNGLPPGAYLQLENSSRFSKTAFKIKHSRFVVNLRTQIEENPIAVVVAVAVLVGAAAKLINAAGHARGSNAYAKQVAYRISKGR